MNRQPYPTDLTDAEWSHLAPHLAQPKSGGRRRLHAVREILHGIFSVLRSGCAWRLPPHDLPPWQTVYHDLRPWRLPGHWGRLHQARHAAVRVKAGRTPQPRAAIIASPSLKTSLGVGRGAVMGARKSTAASATGWSIPQGRSVTRWCTPPRVPIGMGASCCWRLRKASCHAGGRSGLRAPAAAKRGAGWSPRGAARWRSSRLGGRGYAGSGWAPAKDRRRSPVACISARAGGWWNVRARGFCRTGG
jgi:transposase